jgi:hypothetical protein
MVIKISFRKRRTVHGTRLKVKVCMAVKVEGGRLRVEGKNPEKNFRN